MDSKLLVACLALSCLVVVAVAGSSPSHHPNWVHMDQRPHVPARWLRTAPAHADAQLELFVAVKQQNLDVLEERFWKVSDPRNAMYGQYLSQAELRALVAPSDKTRAVVDAWLADFIELGATATWQNDWVILETTAGVASRLLATEFVEYTDARDSRLRVVRSPTGYALPPRVAAAIDLIGGVSDFPESMRVEKAGRTAPRASKASASQAIIEYMLPGSTTLGAFFMPVCPNGNYTLDVATPCADQGDGSSLVGVTQYVTQLSHNGRHAGHREDMVCKPCNEWTSRQSTNCQSAIGTYGYPDTTVFCNSPILTNLKNYYAIEYNIQLSFASNGTGVVDGPIVPYDARPLYLGEFVTPDVLLARYQVPPGGQLNSNPLNSQSVAEFSFQFYSQDELEYFFQQTNVAPGPVEVVGRNDESMPGSEATLDIQYIMGVAQNTTTVFWSSGLTFMKWIIQLTNDENPPLVNSVSYGADEENVAPEIMDRMNTEFQKAANLGLSLLFASGDNGVLSGDPSHPDCTVNTHFVPSYPVTSPYITAVFSSQTAQICTDTIIGLPMTCDAVGEIACSISTGARITTGGGFSDYFGRPPYQDEVVEFYRTNFLQDVPTQYYNTSNRAYPDVSACGRNYMVFVDGDWDPVDGTSASTPTFAGMLTLVNERRLNNGQPVVGFVNPALYQGMFSAGKYTPEYYKTYWDVEMGDNKCGVEGQNCCPYGYTANYGWDATSGLGTPKNIIDHFERVLEQN